MVELYGIYYKFHLWYDTGSFESCLKTLLGLVEGKVKVTFLNTPLGLFLRNSFFHSLSFNLDHNSVKYERVGERISFVFRQPCLAKQLASSFILCPLCPGTHVKQI
jgi:hypothetical protein